MKHYKKLIIPAKAETTQEILDKITCDMCHKEIIKDMYSADKVSVQYKTGYNYSGGGFGEIVEIDMCGDCFKNILIPFLESKGCKMHTVEWDW